MDIFLGLALTAHLGFAGDYNSVHPNVRFEFDNSVVAGAFYNSENNTSLYIAKNFKNENDYFLDIGIVSGYNVDEYPVIPFVRAGKEINDSYSFFVTPGIEDINGKKTVGVVVGFEYKFKVK